MQSFEAELRRKIKELLAFEFNQNTGGYQKTKNQLSDEEQQEIKRLENLLTAFNMEKARIEQKLNDLKSETHSSIVADLHNYQKELKQLTEQIITEEFQKKYDKITNNNLKDPKEKKLVLQNAMMKRKIKESVEAESKKITNEHDKNKKIKDYKNTLAVSTRKAEPDTKDSRLSVENNQGLIEKNQLLANYLDLQYPNLFFTATVIEDIIKTFNQKDFQDLDYALSQLAQGKIERKKINPTSIDYYYSFRTASGIKARIFYQVMAVDNQNKELFIARIVKQHHTRFMN